MTQNNKRDAKLQLSITISHKSVQQHKITTKEPYHMDVLVSIGGCRPHE